MASKNYSNLLERAATLISLMAVVTSAIMMLGVTSVDDPQVSARMHREAACLLLIAIAIGLIPIMHRVNQIRIVITKLYEENASNQNETP